MMTAVDVDEDEEAAAADAAEEVFALLAGGMVFWSQAGEKTSENKQANEAANSAPRKRIQRVEEMVRSGDGDDDGV